MTSPVDRTKEDLKLLIEYFQDHDFFKDILSKKSKEERYAMLECMQLVEKKAKENIFKIDDVGELFYIILEGEVSINLPTLAEKITWQPDEYDDYFEYLCKHHKTIYWPKMAHAKTLMKFLQRALKFEDYRLEPKMRDELTRLKVDNQMVWHLRDIKHLKAGQIFGEVALKTKKPRSATVTAVTDCSFAIMTKHSFEVSLKNSVEKLKEKRLEMLKNFKIFSYFTKIKLEKLTYAMELKKYPIGAHIFKQGQSVDGIYLIKKGDFEIRCNMQLPKEEKLINPEKLPDHMVLRKFKETKNLKNKNVRVAVVSKGMMVGLEEMLEQLIYSGSEK